MDMTSSIDWALLWREICVRFGPGAYSSHGPDHWLRVEGFGRRLAPETGADEELVRLFAWFHDAQRSDDGDDPGHGRRGAELAAAMREEGLLALDDRRMGLLLEACETHAEVLHHADPTVATCFDADRLDLVRYGIRPDPARLNSEAAKRVARSLEVRVEWPRVGRSGETALAARV